MHIERFFKACGDKKLHAIFMPFPCLLLCLFLPAISVAFEGAVRGKSHRQVSFDSIFFMVLVTYSIYKKLNLTYSFPIGIGFD